MTASERRRGWVFFALYLFVFPYLNAWAQRALLGDAEAPAAEANVVYYALLFALALCALARRLVSRRPVPASLLPVLIFCGYFAVHLLIEVQSRYRYFLMPAIAILAGWGLSWLLTRPWRREESPAGAQQAQIGRAHV